jgi:hypothetical protein
MPKAAYITAKKSGITAITKPRMIRDFNERIFLNFIRLHRDANRSPSFDKSLDKSGFLNISRTRLVMNVFID